MAYPTDIINIKSTDLSSFSVKVDGVPLDPTFGIAGITINKFLNKIPTATLVLRDGDVAKQKFKISESDKFEPGNKIEILMGYHNTNLPVFKGIVITHSIQVRQDRPSVLVVELKDEAIKLTVGRKNNCFFDKSDRDIIKKIVGTYPGISFGKPDPAIAPDPLAIGINIAEAAAEAAANAASMATEETHKEMVQYYCTDWDFIVARAEAIGKLVYVNNSKISLIEPVSTGTPLLKLTYGMNIYEFEGEINAVDDFKEVVSKSWDDAKRDFVKGSSKSDPNIANQGNLSQKTLAETVDLGKFLLQHPGKLTTKEAVSWAKSKYMRSSLAKIKGRVKIEGFSGIAPGNIIFLNKFSPRFNKNAFVSGVTHQVTSTSSWYTEVQFGFSQEWFTSKYKDVTDEPAAGLLPGINGLMVGIVKDIKIETGLMVQVYFPLINGLDEITGVPKKDKIWARFAAPYAGLERGVLFRPEINDEVVVGFLNDDPREPVILGSLHSANTEFGTPPEKLKDENYIKGIFTKAKLKMRFDDEKKVITIETPNKNTITVSDDKDFISLKDKSENEILMNDKGITIKSKKKITLDAGEDIVFTTKKKLTQSADKDITLTSKTAKVDVKASTILTLKGTSKVDINPPG